MTTFIRFTFFALFVTCIVNATPASKPVNTVIVLDLSDRLLTAGQASKDKAAILAAFDFFEVSVRKNLFINSKDVFSVVILPQRKSSLRTDVYEEKLRLDMDGILLSDKNKRFTEFKSRLTGIIDLLYIEASRGKKTSDYFGVDIWQFFNQSVNDYLLPNAVNKVVLMTDGYLDFENYAHAAHTKNRYTSSKFLSSLTGTEWKAAAEKKDIGFYPIQNKVLPCDLIVAGLHAKYSGQSELDKLKYFWQKWLTESGFRSHKLIANVNAPQLSSSIKNVL